MVSKTQEFRLDNLFVNLLSFMETIELHGKNYGFETIDLATHVIEILCKELLVA